MGESLVVFAQQVVETLGGHPQPDAKLARQMQALSLTVHIPIVCFGIAFPAMFLFVEGLYLRTGDATYKALAKRWSKVALMVTDIMGKNSRLYVSGEKPAVERAFGRSKDDDGVIDLPGVMSRKKQVAPKLLAALSG